MEDSNYSYEVGDEYPRKGLSVLPSRIKELASSENRQGCPLPEKVEEPKKKKSTKKVDEK